LTPKEKQCQEIDVYRDEEVHFVPTKEVITKMIRSENSLSVERSYR
jgi:hypothetical protein